MSDDINELIARVRAQATLRDLCADIADENGCSLESLTVLSAAVDPYRYGEHNREEAEWFARWFYELVPDGTRVHLRGFHYRLISTTAIFTPDGKPYENNSVSWEWLQDVSRMARWLQYVPFERIRDDRNTPPIIREIRTAPTPPRASIQGVLSELPGYETLLPDLDELLPQIGDLLPETLIPAFDVSPFQRRQSYRIALWGEKSSLDLVLGPLSDKYDTELFLPTGEPTDTMIFEGTQRAAADDRPTIILYFSDFDPSGWQMPISVSRKIQAFRHLRFPELSVQVHRIGLLINQVIEFDLPEALLGPKEKRAPNWKERWGREQTEIDALAGLRPEVLTQIAEDAIKRFHDVTLPLRLRDARLAWLAEAQARLRAHPRYGELKLAVEEAHRKTTAVLTEIRTTVKDALEVALEEVSPKISEKYEEASDAHDQLEQTYDEATEELSQIEPPNIVVPEPEIDRSAHAASRIFDTNDDFVEASHRLIKMKNYLGVAGTRMRRTRL